MTPAKLSVVFFLQLLVIIATCRGVGWPGKRYFDQPQVVGEMIAGVIGRAFVAGSARAALAGGLVSGGVQRPIADIRAVF